MTNVTTKILMSLIDGYVETHRSFGSCRLSRTTEMARKSCEDAIEALVKAANPPLFDISKGIPPATALTLPVIDPDLLDTSKEAGKS